MSGRCIVEEEWLLTSDASFYDFWVEYLDQHALIATRIWHFVGTSAGVIAFLLAIISWDWVYLLIGLMVSYGCSWLGHFFVEKNRPLSFVHPYWALRADLHLFWLMLTRGLTEKTGVFKVL